MVFITYKYNQWDTLQHDTKDQEHICKWSGAAHHLSSLLPNWQLFVRPDLLITAPNRERIKHQSILVCQPNNLFALLCSYLGLYTQQAKQMTDNGSNNGHFIHKNYFQIHRPMGMAQVLNRFGSHLFKRECHQHRIFCPRTKRFTKFLLRAGPAGRSR